MSELDPAAVVRGPRRRLVRLGVGALLGCGLGALTVAGAHAATSSPSSADGDVPAPSTIVQVLGDKHGGFEIAHYDGSWLYPPTLSESVAECGEYDTALARVRCRVEVRTWYRDLTETQAALDWAHAQAGAPSTA